MISYYNGTKFTWTMGRRLESATRSNGSKVTYTYNADGLLTSKKVGNYKLDYFWNGDKLTAQTNGSNIWYFYYDSNNYPIAFEFNGDFYYYVTNLQGDIIAILNDSGECVAEYSYDAWGNCTVIKDTNTIALDNPLRYRGYYYDAHIGLYYLQSRYYDATTGRFINADEPALIGANGGMVSNNLFAYCDNNPVMGVDYSGNITYYRNRVWEYAKFFFNKRNPGFYDYHDNDCANYASQCLLAGGIQMTNKWRCFFSRNSLSTISGLHNNQKFTWYVTPAWRLVVDQYNYFRKQSFIKCKITVRSGVSIKTLLKNRKNDIKIGDLLYFDKNGDGVPDHAAIVSYVTNVMIYYTAHSHNWLRRSIALYLNNHKKAKIYILHINA